jgi:hypothetical protein
MWQAMGEILFSVPSLQMVGPEGEQPIIRLVQTQLVGLMVMLQVVVVGTTIMLVVLVEPTEIMEELRGMQTQMIRVVVVEEHLRLVVKDQILPLDTVVMEQQVQSQDHL